MQASFTASHINSLFDYYGVWFGSPPIITTRKSCIVAHDGSRCMFLDGWQRFSVLITRPDFGKIWTATKVIDTEFHGNAYVVSALALAGHYDRAWERVPEAFRETAADIRALTGLSKDDCAAIFAARVGVKKRLDNRHHYQHRDNERLVTILRQRLAAHDECGVPFGVDDIREVLQ